MPSFSRALLTYSTHTLRSTYYIHVDTVRLMRLMPSLRPSNPSCPEFFGQYWSLTWTFCVLFLVWSLISCMFSVVCTVPALKSIEYGPTPVLFHGSSVKSCTLRTCSASILYYYLTKVKRTPCVQLVRDGLLRVASQPRSNGIVNHLVVLFVV